MGWTERMRLVRVAVNVEQLLYPSPGGIGRYTARVVTLLSELFPEDDLRLFCARHNAAEIARNVGQSGVPQSLPVASMPLPRPLLYDAWHHLGRPALRFGEVGWSPDVVHAPSLAIPPRGPYGMVVTVHDVAVEHFPDAFNRRGRRFHRQGLEVAARRADLVVTGSRVAAEEIMNHSRIPEDRLRVIPLGVTPSTVGPDEAVGLRAQLGLSGRPYVLWVGSLEPRKGVTTLVKAMVTLGRQGGDVPLLVLAGYPGWRQNGLISPADRAELGARLVEVGIVDDPSLQALYQGATIFAFPSLHEGFGLPVLEAMANGAPVVCSDLPVLREVSGAQAVLVETGNVEAWADVLGSLLADDGRRAALAAAGRVQASRFPWEATVAATHEAYADVAPGRPAPGGN